jgi:hypothetical protein
MEPFLTIVTIVSFLILWVTILYYYTPATFDLREMLDSIDKDGRPKLSESPFQRIILDFEAVENWLITIPTAEKYLKFEEVRTTADRVKKYRKRIIIVSPIVLIGFLLLLLLTVDK